MREKATEIFYMGLSVVALSWIVSSTIAQPASDEVGRYQSSTQFKQDGLNRMYVTVIDTTTGQIVRRERVDPGDYEKPTYLP